MTDSEHAISILVMAYKNMKDIQETRAELGKEAAPMLRDAAMIFTMCNNIKRNLKMDMPLRDFAILLIRLGNQGAWEEWGAIMEMLCYMESRTIYWSER